MRRPLEQWFDSESIRPRLVGEFKDRALMTTFGQAGAGVFAAPSAIEREIHDLYRVVAIGRIDSIVERFYAISVERRLKNPAVLAISRAAQQEVFAR